LIRRGFLSWQHRKFLPSVAASSGGSFHTYGNLDCGTRTDTTSSSSSGTYLKDGPGSTNTNISISISMDTKTSTNISTSPSPIPLPGQLPPVVNWHLEPRCNYGCKFCFATFEDVKRYQAEKRRSSATASSSLSKPAGEPQHHYQEQEQEQQEKQSESQRLQEQEQEQQEKQSESQLLLKVPKMIAAAGASKITFVGKLRPANSASLVGQGTAFLSVAGSNDISDRRLPLLTDH
jgi:hypothetical protein